MQARRGSLRPFSCAASPILAAARPQGSLFSVVSSDTAGKPCVPGYIIVLKIQPRISLSPGA